ncbi:hypothetical protein LguiA_002366 [Lonicera macranthoides]
MANLLMYFASLTPATVSKTNNNIPQMTKTNLTAIPSKATTTVAAATTTNHKSQITQDLTLISTPSKHHRYIGKDYTTFPDEFYTSQAEKMSDMMCTLLKVGEDPLEGLMLVDAIQRIGIDYHFQNEIDAILEQEYVNFTNSSSREKNYQDLFHVSLTFRLLRQNGYYVPADVFDNFMGKEGKIKQKYRKDTRALMGLYEASQLSIEGEDALEEAGNFSSQLLNAMMRTSLNCNDARVVNNTLKHPYHKSLAKFTAKNFIRDYNGAYASKNALQELAKMDFYMSQSVHVKELVEISRWWKDLGLAKELKLARDQPLKWYAGLMAGLSDPRLSKQRIELTKPISLIHIIDDIFDLYGTLDELTFFTQAVNRWDFAATKQLPDYMKICFKALYDTTNEIGYNVYKDYGWNPVDSLQRAWSSLFDAFLVEAKWFASGHVPKTDEYLKNGIVSTGVHVVLVHLFFLLGEGTNKESANIVNDNTNIISSVASILRLWDDLGSGKDENQDGHDGSYITCYLEEHQGSSADVAREEVIKMITEAWRRLNKECLSLNPFSRTFTKASLNLARMVPLMYSYDENQGLPDLEDHIKSVLAL